VSKEYNSAFYQANKEKIKARTNKWKSDNPERKRIANKNWHQRNLEKNKLRAWAAHLKRKFNISVSEWDEMYAEQNGRCKICHQPQDTQRLAVDHDHETGEVRGLLCRTCNTAIGLMNDDPIILASAIKYVTRN
jgi:hypothetical protein